MYKSKTLQTIKSTRLQAYIITRVQYVVYVMGGSNKCSMLAYFFINIIELIFIFIILFFVKALSNTGPWLHSPLVPMSSSLHLGPFSAGPNNEHILFPDTIQKPQIVKIFFCLFMKEKNLLFYLMMFSWQHYIYLYASINYSLNNKLVPLGHPPFQLTRDCHSFWICANLSATADGYYIATLIYICLTALHSF